MKRTVTTLAVTAVAFLAVPLVALLVRVPWARLPELVTSTGARQAMWVSVQVSIGALAISVVLGVPLAWLLSRGSFRGRALLRSLATLPMVLPPVVGGVALLLAFGRRGAVGGPLFSLTGLSLPFTGWAAVVAASFVSMPFLVTTLEAGFTLADERYEEVAATLGWGRWSTFRKVTLPMVAPALGAGMAMTWARALGEFGATITFAGNIPGVTQTMPLAVFLQLDQDPDLAYLLAALLLFVSLGVLYMTRDRLTR